jgi:DNA-binding NarL/FixJ family response regulator
MISAAPYRLLIADDHHVVRDGLRLMLTVHGDMQVVAEASDGPSALELTLQLRPDVLLLDVHLPLKNGLDVLRALRQVDQQTKVLMMSGAADASTMQRALSMGANGLFTKSQGADALHQALQHVLQGGRYVSAEFAVQSPAPDPLLKLTPREREVLHAVAVGASSKQIAEQLGLSLNTVHKHRENLIDKLGVRGSGELVAYAARVSAL